METDLIMYDQPKGIEISNEQAGKLQNIYSGLVDNRPVNDFSALTLPVDSAISESYFGTLRTYTVDGTEVARLPDMLDILRQNAGKYSASSVPKVLRLESTQEHLPDLSRMVFVTGIREMADETVFNEYRIICHYLGNQLVRNGYTLLTGGAVGIDSAFTTGAIFGHLLDSSIQNQLIVSNPHTGFIPYMEDTKPNQIQSRLTMFKAANQVGSLVVGVKPTDYVRPFERNSMMVALSLGYAERPVLLAVGGNDKNGGTRDTVHRMIAVGGTVIFVDNVRHNLLKGNTLYGSVKGHPHVKAVDFREIVAEIGNNIPPEA